jgi:hypothetical protein
MVAIVAGPLEAAAVALLRILGVTVAGGAIADEAERQKREAAARERQEAAERARALPIACAETQGAHRQRCRPCEADTGIFYQRNVPARLPWLEYQARVTGMPNGPTFIMEWVFNGVVFDGFESRECLLKEAKGAYDQFFDDAGDVLHWWSSNVNKIQSEFTQQSLAANPRPSIRLEWFWQQPLSYRFFSRVLSPIAEDVPHHYHP